MAKPRFRLFAGKFKQPSAPAPVPEITGPPPMRSQKRKRRKKYRIRRFVEGVISLTVTLLLVIVLRTYVFTGARVDGPSMEPTLRSGQMVWVDRLGLRLEGPRRGDVVLLHSPEGHVLIKRVAALQGDTVSWVRGQLFINGQPQLEPYAGLSNDLDMEPFAIPLDMVYVLGDNREYSHDSRTMGPVAESALIGRAVGIFWPLSDLQSLTAYTQDGAK